MHFIYQIRLENKPLLLRKITLCYSCTFAIWLNRSGDLSINHYIDEYEIILRIINLVLYNSLILNHVFIIYILYISRYVPPKEDIALDLKKNNPPPKKETRHSTITVFFKIWRRVAQCLYTNIYLNVETVFWTVLLSCPSEDISFHLFLPISTWCWSHRRDQVKAT